MKIEKKQYNFYLSYWESLKALTTDKEKVEFMTILNEIYFFEKHIDKVEIKNPNVKLLFTSVKHSIKTSIQGYCDKTGLNYDDIFEINPTEPPCQPPTEPPCQQYIMYNKKYIIGNIQQIKEKVLNNWNIKLFNLHNLPKIKDIDKTREKQLIQRLEECDKDNIENAVKIFFNAWNEKIKSNHFYKGENERKWKMTFDFAITKSKFTPILEEYLQNKEVENEY